MGHERDLAIKEYQEKIQLRYDANNIIHEKSELYYDFLSSLLSIINETYLGSDIIKTNDDMKGHFTWAFNKVLENFKYEKIKFKPLSTFSYDYLWFFIYKGFYTSDLDGKYEGLLEYFRFLFDYTTIKTSAELDSYIDFYKMFEQNLKKLN